MMVCRLDVGCLVYLFSFKLDVLHVNLEGTLENLLKEYGGTS